MDRGGLSRATCSHFIFPRPGPAFWCPRGSDWEAGGRVGPAGMPRTELLPVSAFAWGLPPQPVVTGASQQHPFCSLSCLLVDLCRLQSPPAHGLPCGGLQVSPSPAGFEHGLPCFLNSRGLRDKPKPCGLDLRACGRNCDVFTESDSLPCCRHS